MPAPLVPPRPLRELVRERVPLLLEREPVLRADFDVPVERAPPLLGAAAEARLVPELDDLAREDDFLAPLVERFVVERAADDLRAPVERLLREVEDAELLPPLAEPSTLHLPDITRWAASATASAISEPSFVALATTLLAACDAVSAASSPASRIFLRAAGLALIAAAAAASPAANISLLIAALASLSTVLSPAPERDDDALEGESEEVDREELEREELEREEEPLRADLAIANLPRSRERHFKAVPVPE